jgi:hypothetical protein
VGLSSKRISSSLAKTHCWQGPFAPPELPGFITSMAPSDSSPGTRTVMYFRQCFAISAPAVIGNQVRSLRFLTFLSVPAVPYHPGESNRYHS